jgi:photosystem II stability/assembly factor-like uncharacterized protein
VAPATTAAPSPLPDDGLANAASSTWVPVTGNLAGMPSQCGTLTLVSAEPAENEVIAGVSNGGLWASVDGSSTWTRIGTGAGSAQIDNRPLSITYDPSQPGTFWESGTYGTGAYVTHDNGTTFQPLGSLTHSDWVSVDLHDPARATLLSGRHETSGVYRSTNGGAVWQDLSSALPADVGFTIAPLVLSPQVYLMGTTSGWNPTASRNAGIYRTTNGGTTWSRVYPSPVLGPPLVTASGAIYWLLKGNPGLIMSTNQGITWQYVTQISSTSGSLIQLPNGWLAGIGRWITVSTDGGQDWAAIGGELPFEASGFTYSPTQKAFYAWHSDRDCSANNTVAANAIMRLPANLPAH